MSGSDHNCVQSIVYLQSLLSLTVALDLVISRFLLRTSRNLTKRFLRRIMGRPCESRPDRIPPRACWVRRNVNLVIQVIITRGFITSMLREAGSPYRNAPICPEALLEARRPAGKASGARRRSTNAPLHHAPRAFAGFARGAGMKWTDILALAVSRRGNSLGSWGIALVFFLLALAIRSALPPEAGRLPFVAFFPAIIATVLVCGFLPGAVVLCMSVVAGWYLFLPPIHTFPRSTDDVISLVAFVLAATMLLAVVEGLAQAILKAENLALANADLFRELQHRVANNFQIVSATLQKGRRGVADLASQAAIDTAISRVQAMAAMHRQLYDANSYASGLEPVLIAVVAEVFANIPVSVKVAISPRELTLGEMTAITLLVNEAALNAAKHVFRSEIGSKFEVMLSECGPSKLELLIRDDGPGIPDGVQVADGGQRFGLSVMREPRSAARRVSGVAPDGVAAC